MSTLILLRHGQSTWNLSNRFTGWYDEVGLTELGSEEAEEAGKRMVAAGLRPEVVHTSVLLRAIQTANVALEQMGLAWLPVRRSWRLNERHYGALQGLDKQETSRQYGEDAVKRWRRGYSVRPPVLELDDPRHPRFDPRYRILPADLIPATESLEDVVARLLPYWYDGIVPDLAAGRCVLIASHGNSLRALVKHLDGLSEEDVLELNIPTGIPRVYELDEHFRVVSWRYLGDQDEVLARAQAVARQASTAP